MLRWFVNQESAPCYLVIPSRSVPLKNQEDAVRELVYSMTRLEAQAAAALYSVSTELDINQTLVGAYQEVPTARARCGTSCRCTSRWRTAVTSTSRTHWPSCSTRSSCRASPTSSSCTRRPTSYGP